LTHNQEDDTLHGLERVCAGKLSLAIDSLYAIDLWSIVALWPPTSDDSPKYIDAQSYLGTMFPNVIFGLLLITYDLCHSLLLVPPPSGKEGGVLVAAGWVKPTDTEGYPSGRNPTGEMPVTKESTRISVEPRPLNKRGGTETVHLGLNGQPDFPPGKRLALSRRSCHPKY